MVKRVLLLGLIAFGFLFLQGRLERIEREAAQHLRWMQP